MTKTLDLAAIRQQIDGLDENIQTLITRRAGLAEHVAKAKRASGETSNFYRPEREAEVLDKVTERNQGPLSDATLAGLFREIMSACLALQQPLQVAYLGPAGTFSQSAAIKHFGHAVQTVPLPSIDDVFREVEAGAAHYGVVPIENSTEGGVNFTLDLMLHSSVRICSEVELRVHQNLLSKAESLESIKTLYAHPQSLAQCREWLDQNLAGVERIPASSNAEAASMAAQQDGLAAIAGAAAAETYELTVLAGNIEDQPNNTTRFAIIGDTIVAATGNDRTSLLVAVDNRPGALFDLLEPLSRHDVSMSRVESRPSRREAWEYVFFVDVEGHRDDENVAAALEEIRQRASLFRVLGSYPRARV